MVETGRKQERHIYGEVLLYIIAIFIFKFKIFGYILIKYIINLYLLIFLFKIHAVI